MLSQSHCLMMQHKYDDSDKHYNLFARAQLHYSVNEALNTKKGHNSDIKRDKLMEFR